MGTFTVLQQRIIIAIRFRLCVQVFIHILHNYIKLFLLGPNLTLGMSNRIVVFYIIFTTQWLISIQRNICILEHIAPINRASPIPFSVVAKCCQENKALCSTSPAGSTCVQRHGLNKKYWPFISYYLTKGHRIPSINWLENWEWSHSS